MAKQVKILFRALIEPALIGLVLFYVVLRLKYIPIGYYEIESSIVALFVCALTIGLWSGLRSVNSPATCALIAGIMAAVLCASATVSYPIWYIAAILFSGIVSAVARKLWNEWKDFTPLPKDQCSSDKGRKFRQYIYRIYFDGLLTSITYCTMIAGFIDYCTNMRLDHPYAILIPFIASIVLGLLNRRGYGDDLGFKEIQETLDAKDPTI